MSLSGRLPPTELFPAGEPGLRSRFVEVASGLGVRVVEAGAEDAPAVVLIPGWGCSAWIFHETLRPLAEGGFRAIAVELKGHGLSDKPQVSSEYTTVSMRDHTIEILDALGLRRAALVGHSMGAAIAVQVAAAAPERVSAVVMVAPVGFAGVPLMPLFRSLTPSFAVRALPWLAPRALIRVMLAVVYGDIRRPSHRDVDEFWAPTQFPGFTRSLRHLLHSFGWKEEFPRLAVPWMTIVGSSDKLSPADDIGRYAGPAEMARSLVVEGGGHVLFDEAPKIINSALIDFLRSDSQRNYIKQQDE